MVIHFICRGNAFRSLIAEAYLKSLGLKNVEVLSSGTVANEFKAVNEVNFQKTLKLLRGHGLERFAKTHYADQLPSNEAIEGDVAVCMNRRTYDECKQIGELPGHVVVWGVTDIGEPGRVPGTEAERWKYMEEVYQEIVSETDELVVRLGLDV